MASGGLDGWRWQILHTKAANMNTADKEHLPCKIVGISGSLRSGSYTTLAVRLALKGAEELEECQTKLIDLRDYQLLFCDGKDDESQFPKDVFRLREEVKQAHGIILADDVCIDRNIVGDESVGNDSFLKAEVFR